VYVVPLGTLRIGASFFGECLTEESLMAREPEKSAQETSRAKSETPAGAKSAGNREVGEAKPGVVNSADLLKAQHLELQTILAKRLEAKPDRDAIVKEFAAAWLPHVAVEQDVLVPALKNAGIDEDKLAAVAIHKDIINWLLADLLSGESREFGQAKLEALAKQFNAHVEGADAEDHGLFAFVSSAEAINPGLNAQMKERYDRLKNRFADMDESIGEAIAMLAPRRLSVPSSSQRNRREYEMSRYSNDRDRDEQGRFMSNDERGYSRGGSDRDEHGRFMSEGGARRSMGRERDDEGRFTSDVGYSRGRFQGDDQHYGPRSLGSMGHDRNDEGRFTSDNGSSRRRFQGDDQHYGPRSLGSMGRDHDDQGRFISEGESRSRGRYDDDDDRYSRRSMGQDRYDRYRGSSEGRENSGWYGDSEGHSEASRRGWDNPRHGESGWYGDSEGHSEASRRGWEGRGGGGSPRYEERSQRYDEMQSRSRSRYDDDRDYRRGDDYDRGNGGRGQGWSGDPEGHSEASRRGWQNRR
jgi:hypothetical protein